LGSAGSALASSTPGNAAGLQPASLRSWALPVVALTQAEQVALLEVA